MKDDNYPIPGEYTHWTELEEEDVQESSDKEDVIDEQGNEVIEPVEDIAHVLLLRLNDYFLFIVQVDREHRLNSFLLQ